MDADVGFICCLEVALGRPSRRRVCHSRPFPQGQVLADHLVQYLACGLH